MPSLLTPLWLVSSIYSVVCGRGTINYSWAITSDCTEWWWKLRFFRSLLLKLRVEIFRSEPNEDFLLLVLESNFFEGIFRCYWLSALFFLSERIILTSLASMEFERDTFYFLFVLLSALLSSFYSLKVLCGDLYFLLNNGEIIIFFPSRATGSKLSIKPSGFFLCGLYGLFSYFSEMSTLGETGISSLKNGLNNFPILILASTDTSGYGLALLALPDLFWDANEFMLLRT